MSTPSGNAHSEQQFTGRGSQPQESLSRFMYGSSAAQHRITTDEEPPTPTRMAVMGQLSKRHMADPQPSDETDTQSLHSVESMQGGRLWKLAGEAAKEQEQQQHRRFPGARLAETFIEKTRSRAVPDANMIHDHERKKILNGKLKKEFALCALKLQVSQRLGFVFRYRSDEWRYQVYSHEHRSSAS